MATTIAAVPLSDLAVELASLEAQIRRRLESEDFIQTELLLRRHSETLLQLIGDRPPDPALARTRDLYFWMHRMASISRAGYAARLEALNMTSSYLASGSHEPSRPTLQITL